MEQMRKIGKLILAPLDFLMKYFKLVVLLLILVLLFGSQESNTASQANLAKLYLKGAIYSSDSIRDQIQEIKKHPNIQGVLLIIDSPGGSVGASVEVANLIKELRDTMPVITYVESVMASGSYYGGMYSDKIIANRGAIIGSIGVIFSGFNFKPLLDKIGIEEQSLQQGEYKSIGTPLREWKLNEKQFLDALLQEQYQMFVSDVLKTRNLTDTNPKAFANGKVFTAHQALKLGLIDQVGSQNQAIEELSKIAQIQTPIWLEKSKTDQIIEKLSNASIQLISHFLSGQIQ